MFINIKLRSLESISTRLKLSAHPQNRNAMGDIIDKMHPRIYRLGPPRRSAYKLRVSPIIFTICHTLSDW